jgi:hypothetical protein
LSRPQPKFSLFLSCAPCLLDRALLHPLCLACKR